jgi:hypothetical protein
MAHAMSIQNGEINAQTDRQRDEHVAVVSAPMCWGQAGWSHVCTVGTTPQSKSERLGVFTCPATAPSEVRTVLLRGSHVCAWASHSPCRR